MKEREREMEDNADPIDFMKAIHVQLTHKT